MALAFADRVRETTTTTGTGTITLAGAVTGYQSFSAIGNGNTTYYTINAGSQWEVGIGTYTASGTTLSRDTVLSSSNAGSLVDFSAGTKDVFAGYPAGKVVIQDASGNVGIGTASPGAKLDVAGEIRIYPSSSPAQLRFGVSGVEKGKLAVDSSSNMLFETAGSERMRIDASGSITANVDIRAPIFYDSANTAYYLDPTGSTSLNVAGNMLASGNLTLNNGANRYVRIGSATNYSYDLQTTGDDFQIIEAGTTPRLTIKYPSGNVGIGTTGPAVKLEVSGTLDEIVRVTSSGSPYISWYAGVTRRGYVQAQAGSFTVASDTAIPLIFATNATERMRIDTSGNVGVGVTPSASDLPTIQSTYGIISGNAQINIAQNAYYSGGWKYTGSAAATLYFQGSGAHNWQIAASGTAGNAISFTQAMTLNTSGNLGIGTTGPSYKLDVAGQARAYNTASTYGELQLLAQYTGTAGPLAVGQGSDSTGYVVNTANAALVFGNNGTERMRITSGGLVGIAVSPTTHRLEVNGNVYTFIGQSYYCYTADYGLGTPDSNGLQLFTGSGDTLRFGHRASGTFTERMRIDSSGNVGIGTTSPSQRLDATVSSGTEGVGLGVTNSLAGGYGSGINFYSFRTDGTTKLTAGAIQMYGQSNWADAANTSSNMRFYTVGNNSLTERMRIDASGNVGIGTTNVVYPLMVSNGGAAGLEFSPTAVASSPLIQSYNRSGAAYTQLTYSALQHVFWISGTERMRITSAGYVGIGTSSPNGTLTVFNSATFDARTSGINVHRPSSYGQYGSFAYDGGTTYFSTTYTGGGAGVYGAYVFQAYDSTSTPVTRMAIDYLGNVGIGTSSPGAKLTIYDTANAQVLAQGTTSYAQFHANNTSGSFHIGIDNSTGTGFGAGAYGRFLYSTGVYPMVFFTNSTERMRIDSSGNLLVGTTTAQGKLSVNSATGNVGFNTGTSSSPERGNLWYDTDGTGWKFNIGKRQSGSFTAQMTVQDNGYVGIGTSSPQAMLHVAGGVLIQNANAHNEINFSGSEYTNIYSGTTSGMDIGITSTSSAYIRFLTNNTEQVRITSGGNLLLGTTASSGAPYIVELNTTSDTRIGLKAGNVLTGIIQATTNNFAFGTSGASTVMTFSTNGAERFRILAGGGITSSDLADAVGYKGLPQNSQTTGYTLALSDMGKHISITTGNITIPANGSVAFPVGAAVTIYNNSGSTQTISITTDTLRQAGTTNTGTRTLAAYGVATVLKVASTTWVISGNVS